MTARRFCAFNKTRGIILSLDVEVLDAAMDPLRVLRVLMEGLSSETSTGLWLTHFKAVPVAKAVCPFDLIYLDKDHCVVHAVSLTVDSGYEPFEGEPGSALVLPSSIIASSQTERGDQLVIVAAPENARIHAEPAPDSSMRHQQPSLTVTSQPHVPDHAASTADDLFAHYLTGTVHLTAPPPSAPVQAQKPEAPAPAREPQPFRTEPEPVQPAAFSIAHEEPAAAARPDVEYVHVAPPTLQMRVLRWLRLQPEPAPLPPNRVRDRRRAYRLNRPELVAYFFTGGAPQPYRVDNISVTGFLLQADDMWMPGTIIRMTLQRIGSRGDRRGDSVTVFSRMVRRVGRGSAFEFVFAGVPD